MLKIYSVKRFCLVLFKNIEVIETNNFNVKITSQLLCGLCGNPTLFMKPILGDLKGYCSGRWTLTFQTPPSYGVFFGPKNFTINSSKPLSIVTSCFDSISLITSVSIRLFPALGEDILTIFLISLGVTLIISVRAALSPWPRLSEQALTDWGAAAKSVTSPNKSSQMT